MAVQLETDNLAPVASHRPMAEYRAPVDQASRARCDARRLPQKENAGSRARRPPAPRPGYVGWAFGNAGLRRMAPISRGVPPTTPPHLLSLMMPRIDGAEGGGRTSTAKLAACRDIPRIASERGPRDDARGMSRLRRIRFLPYDAPAFQRDARWRIRMGLYSRAR